MNYILDHHLFILADGHHFLLMARDPQNTISHLKIIKRVQYQPSKFMQSKRDNPGRTMNKKRQARTTYAHTDLSSIGDGRYLAYACQSVDTIFRQGNYKALTMVGEPKVLDQIKAHLSTDMRKKIQTVIYKNYTKLPIENLEHLIMYMN